MTPPEITLFADFTSPESYLTEVALSRLAAEVGAAVRFRAAEAAAGDDLAARVAELQPLAAELCVPLRLPPLLAGTSKAHEASLFAREQGRERELRDALHHAYWVDGRDIGRIDVLQDLAAGVGLDPFDARVALDIDRYRDEVLRDRELARRLGIARAPVLYLGTGPGARILVGAQTPAALDEALRRQL